MHLMSSYPDSSRWSITTEDVLAAPCDTCGKPVVAGETLRVRGRMEEGRFRVRRYHYACDSPPIATFAVGATVCWEDSLTEVEAVKTWTCTYPDPERPGLWKHSPECLSGMNRCPNEEWAHG